MYLHKEHQLERGRSRNNTARHMNVVTSNDAIFTKKTRDFATLLAYTYNVCGLKQVDKIERLVQFSVEKCIDFTCIQETWLEGRYYTDIETIEVNSKETVSFTFFRYGQEKQINRGSGGVGIFYRNEEEMHGREQVRLIPYMYLQLMVLQKRWDSV